MAASKEPRGRRDREDSMVTYRPMRFRRAFLGWFAPLMTLFVVLNLLGSHGSKQHTVGFPCVIAWWIEIEEYRSATEFAPSSIFINAVVALAVSAMLALVCALARARYSSKRKE
jgi:hypothetical protein